VLESFVFVTGAPRSGTTFVSDWLSQLPDCYCAHEVLADLAGRTPDEAIAALALYAASGSDRLTKLRQREFLQWPSDGLSKVSATLIGWKEPVTWPRGGLGAVPEPLRSLLRTRCRQAVVAVRHPFDVVASGRRREATTTNWRPLSVVEHCNYWLSTLDLIRGLAEAGSQVLVLHWEEMVADPAGSARDLGRLLHRVLPNFDGYERGREELQTMRTCVDRKYGLVGHEQRRYLSDDDQDEIRRLLRSEAEDLGYALDDGDPRHVGPQP
jgi:hypothetical protein